MNAKPDNAPFDELIERWWFRLPMALRQRWWAETDYGRKLASEELKQAVLDAAAELK